MAYGREPSSILSVVAFACAAGAVFGLGPLLAVVAMVCAALAAARGEGLAGAAALVGLVVLVLSFLLPVGTVLAAGGT